VLGHDEFGINDNFFAIGGHSLAASLLVSRIEQSCGHAPSVAVLLQNPTIAMVAPQLLPPDPEADAELLTRSTLTRKALDPCFVALHREGRGAPIVVIHGYGGDVFCYGAFANALAPTRPIYGLQARGIDGRDERHRADRGDLIRWSGSAPAPPMRLNPWCIRAGPCLRSTIPKPGPLVFNMAVEDFGGAALNHIDWSDSAIEPLDRDGPQQEFTPFDLVDGPEMPLLALIRDRLLDDPQKPAVDDGSQQLTRAELLAQISSLAAVIADQVSGGAPVGVLLGDGVQLPVAWLACLAAGSPAVLLNGADGADRLSLIAATSRLAAVISDRPVSGLRVIAPDGHPPASWAPKSMGSGEPAFIVWTSGSTGRPKGIVHSQRSVLFRAGLLVNSGHLSSADHYLSLNTASSMGALLNAVAALLSGACLHRVDLNTESLFGVLKRIQRSRITAVIAVPALFRALCRLNGANALLSSVRLVSSNGEALLAADLAMMRAVLRESCAIQMVYGATETQAGMRFIPATESPDGAQVAAGRPLPGVQWAIVDENGSMAPAGSVGELWIRSRYTAIGEWEDGACVPGRLILNGVDASRCYAMGDLVRWREDGVFVVIGRKDRQLKVNGYRIEPVEIEAILRAEPAVLDAAVLPLCIGESTQLAAFVAAGSSPPAGLERSLLTVLEGSLPPFMRPQRLHILETLPLLSGNKLDVQALQHIDQEGRPR
jgi:acyl-coenzyme A synthetase/AMP-(fatty) acid ligase